MSYRGENFIEYNDEAKIKAALVGRRIVAASVEDASFTLDNGVAVKVHANEGCDGCGSGWYQLDTLETTEAVITNVRLSDRSVGGQYEETDTIYEIFVLAANKEQMILSVSGSDGNGCYGTGYKLEVTVPK